MSAKGEYFTFDCGAAWHFLHVCRVFGEDDEIDVLIVNDGSPPFWWRVRLAINYILRRDKLHIGEVVLDRETALRLADTLQTLAKKPRRRS
jgi:hypothetical protein